MSFSSVLFIALRSAAHYRKTGIIVALGLALAGAVTTGSLIIGDCVKGSIRHIATSRLGTITHAVRLPNYGRIQLADEIDKRLAADGKSSACPAILVQGFVENQNSGNTVPIVNIIGIDDRFTNFYKQKIHMDPGYAAVNAALARDLALERSDSILITTGRESSIPSQSLFAHIDPVQNQRSMRMEVKTILPDDSLGGFRLDASTQTPRNVFVPLSELCEMMGKQGKVNTVLLNTASGIEQITSVVHSAAQAEDYGLSIQTDSGKRRLIIKSDSVSIPDSILSGITKYAESVNSSVEESSVYLADKLAVKSSVTRVLHYSVLSASNPQPEFKFASGRSIESTNQILLNTWAAEDLGVQVGDIIDLEYLVSRSNGNYTRQTIELKLQGIVEISGPAHDSAIVPDFEGITDADRIGDWEPPFPVDLTKVSERDDLYWQKYKALPKAFLHPDTLKKIWTASSDNQNAWITTAVVPIGKDDNLESVGLAAQVKVAQMQSDPPGRISPVREIALKSAQGNTDLAGVFFGLGMLLIYACAALSGSFVRISVLHRAKNIGIMLAEGYSKRQTVSIILTEWTLWTIGGALLAVPLGVLYAWLIVRGLNSWWQGAVGQTVLFLHVNPITLIYGFLTAFLIGIVTVLISLRGITNKQVIDLLHDRNPASKIKNKEALSPDTRGMWASITVVVLVSIINTNYTLMLALPLSLLAGIVISSGIINIISRRRSRLSLLGIVSRKQQAWIRYDAAIQLAAAAVMLLVVSSQVRTVSKIERDSGTGGFALRAVSSLPLGYDLNTPGGRAKLGFQTEDEKLFEGVRIYSLTAADGDDISCLNLAKPTQPRLLGIPDNLIQRGGFGLAPSAWADFDTDNSGIPAIGDADSVTWNLKKKIGDTVEIVTDNGNIAKVKIKYSVKQSIFAGELLIPQSSFNALYPDNIQPRYYLIECPEDRIKPLADVLRRTLGNSGLQVQMTTEIINSFMGVQNTYIAVLMALGGLALILGSGGQLIGVLRSIYQNKSEYALLLSIGFSRLDIVKILVLEHAVIPGLTVLVSTVCCIILMLPAWISGQSTPNWLWPALVLPIMAAVGLTTCTTAAMKASQGNLIAGLRTE